LGGGGGAPIPYFLNKNILTDTSEKYIVSECDLFMQILTEYMIP